ncbi:MAG: cysteine hydrolase [Firmicutes bacterium]|jgi:nicotinamidase-related amidase|nr:cysteine hydrolase [Bacillota bacterium]
MNIEFNFYKQVEEMINHLQNHELKDYKNRSLIVIIDMVNGFAKKGPLYSLRINELIPGIKHLLESSKELGIDSLAFLDCHKCDSLEFDSYVKHCVEDTFESMLIEELHSIGVDKTITKGSTNGFIEEEFQKYLKENINNYDNFIVVGNCTDICISQFATTLKAYLNKENLKKSVIVPFELVDTYDSENHNGNFLANIALYNMNLNGVTIIKNFSY